MSTARFPRNAAFHGPTDDLILPRPIALLRGAAIFAGVAMLVVFAAVLVGG